MLQQPRQTAGTSSTCVTSPILVHKKQDINNNSTDNATMRVLDPLASNNMMNNPRTQAQDAASWYLSHLDVYRPHSENVQLFLRGPLLAVTLNGLQSPSSIQDGMTKLPEESTNVTTPTPTTSGESTVEDEKKTSSSMNNNYSNSWRDYVTTSSVSLGMWSEKDQEAYDCLSRRSKARFEAFLAGCTVSVPSDVIASSAAASVSSSTLPSRPGKRNDSSSSTLSESGPTATTTGQPPKQVSIEDGLVGFGASSSSSTKQDLKKPPMLSSVREQGKTFIRQISNSATPAKTKKFPQISEQQLVIRLELYIRSLHRVRTIKEECVIAMEPPKTIRTRSLYITESFIASAGCVRSMNPVLKRLLTFLTMELLAVDTLAEGVSKVIRRIVSEYEHQTSFASLAFLSTPEVSAESRLTPLIVKYLRYLQSEWEDIVQECELERMLSRALDNDVRKMFKTIEFQSIGHLLEVCQQFRSKLQNIELPPTVCACADDITSLSSSAPALRQALRDLQREVITVNGHVLPPVTSRKDLIHLLSQTLNSRTLTSLPPKTATIKPKSPKVAGALTKGYRRTESCPSKLNERGMTTSLDNNSIRQPPRPDDVLISSEYDSSDYNNNNIETTTKDKKPRNATHRRSFQLSTVDFLTRRLLIAASRTGTGGDAFFLVRDLFGGEDVEVVPSKNLAQAGRMFRPGTIEIVVRLASVTIKCHGSFDVYPKSLVGDCEPLIQFHTTTTETITLQEVRSGDSSDDGGGGATQDDTSSSSDSNGKIPSGRRSVMVVQEKKTNKTGWRTVSIRPALYEKVEIWNTPS